MPRGFGVDPQTGYKLRRFLVRPYTKASSMRQSCFLPLVGFFALLCIMPSARAQAPGDEAAAVLAGRIFPFAQGALTAKNIGEPHWRQSAALFEACSRLEPAEPRYPRLQGEALLQARDLDGAIEALSAVRRLDPQDQFVQTQLIDLYLARMEGADQRIAYVRDLVGRTTLAAPVRSYAAYRSAVLLFERMRDDQAMGLLGEALRLNPRNLPALQLQYQREGSHGSAFERVKSMLAMIRANPLQPAILADLAGELADVGLTEPAVRWYGAAINAANRLGMALPPGALAGYSAALFISDHPQVAANVVQQVLNQNPEDPDAWFVMLAITQNNNDVEGAKKIRQSAAAVLHNRLARARQAIGDRAATTRPLSDPAPEELPDLAGDAQRLQKLDDPQRRDELTGQYISALADLAWFETYFNNKSAPALQAAKVIRAIQGDASVTAARLEGWGYLRGTKPDEARHKLSAISDRDALAELGIIQLDRAAKDADPRRIASTARKLVSEHPSGALGAILWAALRDQAQRITPTMGDHIQAQLDEFPKNWLDIIELPQQFYGLRIRPLRVSHGFGEPMLCRVTLQNLGEQDLTIGPDGVIQRDLWFDAQLKGVADQLLPGVAYDRLSQAMVLAPRQRLSQVVRIDQGSLDELMRKNPGPSLTFQGLATTNPRPAGQGVAPGPAGYRIPFDRLIERTAYPLTDDASKQRIYDEIDKGTVEQRMANLQVLAAYIRLLGAEGTDPQLRPLAGEFLQVIRRARRDSSPAVGAFASLHAALLETPADAMETRREMARADGWFTRLLSMVAMTSLPLDQQKRLAEPLADDADPTVARYARAALAIASTPATAPATAPSQPSPPR